MIRVEMLVQTTYKGELLRQGKIYEVEEDTAKRWDASNIAKIIDND